MNKHYIKIQNKLIPLIYGGMSSQSLDIQLPLIRDAIAPDRDTNLITSTDYFYGVLALGEGPIYAVNPNGPQDMEFNDASLDDLINLDGDGGFNNTRVSAFYFLGNPDAAGIPKDFKTYFGRVVTPQSLSSSILLKYGNLLGVPKVSVTQDTSQFGWDGLEFNFTINGLYNVDNNGAYQPTSITVKITLINKITGEPYAPIAGVFTNPVEVTQTGVIQTPTKFSKKINIPSQYINNSGYRFVVEKTTADSNSSRVAEQVAFNGWDEINYDKIWYTRTALLGIVLRAYAEYSGSIPTITSLIKGLLVKVPSNYNQPILESGEIDWRQLEVAETGTWGYTVRGYQLESSKGGTFFEKNPIIYKGTWDGTFVKKWTQNPVWIIYDLLTDKAHGLGIPEEYIDKFKFYKVAQYCDAVDSKTGRFVGLTSYADGTFRYKPRGYSRQDAYNADSLDAQRRILNRENQIGLPAGTEIRERRFVCNISINVQKQVIDIINQITALFRGILIYSGGKISLNVDLPGELPVAIFNETNIVKDSLQISGIKESELISGVEVSYMDTTNHYKRELVKIDDPRALEELSYIENIRQVDLVGCDRRSQAMRFGQYLLASNKYIRRKVGFKTSSEAVNLSVGDVISVSQKMTGVSWGYGGRVAANTATAGLHVANVILEHFTSPAISTSIFTSNTLPLALRIINRQSDRVDLYLISNTSYNYQTASNSVSGIDLLELKVISKLNPETKIFQPVSRFDANVAPIKNDIWSLGEVNPSNYLTSTSDKLFKVISVEKDVEDFVAVQATEYVSNVYTDSDTLINYTPVRFPKPISPLTTPPTMSIEIKAEPIVRSDGAVVYNLRVNPTTDLSSYPFGLQPEILVADPDDLVTIEEIS